MTDGRRTLTRVIFAACLTLALLACNNATNPLNLLSGFRVVENVPVTPQEDIERVGGELAKAVEIRQKQRAPRSDHSAIAPRPCQARQSRHGKFHDVRTEVDGLNGCGATLRC